MNTDNTIPTPRTDRWYADNSVDITVSSDEESYMTALGIGKEYGTKLERENVILGRALEEAIGYCEHLPDCSCSFSQSTKQCDCGLAETITAAEQALK